MIFRAKAPLRLSFCGGGTDVLPYLADHGGCVLSTTIDHFAYASLRTHQEPTITVKSLDYDATIQHNMVDQPLPYDGNLDLVKAVLNRLHLPEIVGHEDGIDIFLHSDAPPGSGLGSSSTLVVALIGLLKERHHLTLTNYEIADLAYQIERVDMSLKGGKQDHYAAAFGGFNFIEFHTDSTIVNPLRIAPDVLNELQYNLLLCYTGATRMSANIIDKQVQNVLAQNADVLSAMEQLKQITLSLKNALLRGQLDDFGHLLHQAWLNKKQMADTISNPHIDELYEAAIQQGALGGKITGAGGGGYMFFYCPFESKHKIAQALTQQGAQVVDFAFDAHGLQTWAVR